MTETNTSGELFLLVSLSGYPTGDNFEYYDISESDFHDIHILWEDLSERISRTYFIAVLVSSASVATDALEYSLTGNYLPTGFLLPFSTYSSFPFSSPSLWCSLLIVSLFLHSFIP